MLVTGRSEIPLLDLLPLDIRGGFSREVNLTVPLVDVVAAAMDGRYILSPVGQARTTLLDGLLRELAPPEFVERVLPGLNLAAFAFGRGDATTRYEADGTVRDVATLAGGRYSLSIEGAVAPDGTAAYDLGVTFTGADGGPAWMQRLAGQRIGLLRKTFRLVDGTKADEGVTWTFPAESLLRSFIENSLLHDVLPKVLPEKDSGKAIDLFDLLQKLDPSGRGGK